MGGILQEGDQLGLVQHFLSVMVLLFLLVLLVNTDILIDHLVVQQHVLLLVLLLDQLLVYLCFLMLVLCSFTAGLPVFAAGKKQKRM